MALSIFDDKSKPPKDAELATALKDSFLFWNESQKIDRVEIQAFVYRVGIYQQDNRLGNETQEQGPNHSLLDTS